MCHFVYLFFTFLGALLPVIDARAAVTFSSKEFDGILLNNRTISQVQCFKAGINTMDFTRGTEMLSAYCKNFKIAPLSPYVAIVGSTTAYVCSEVNLEICSGDTMDLANQVLDDKCGPTVAGHVRLNDVNATLYGRGVLESPLCPMSSGLMKNYHFYPIPTFINGTRVGKW
ncbi:hypothetical protein E4U42_004574 [Claviceps africana]|uniref:Ecp2 effector protein domain-containing protein n=1 Tax=Claviceps africana TaxID=83212 RepID=A0A8K0NGX1_9HYPO|nr:hypothetical protein E4U42_004574 [Claviceps africana]